MDAIPFGSWDEEKKKTACHNLHHIVSFGAYVILDITFIFGNIPTIESAKSFDF